jgi:diguanylate cyclase (GGDEF)-like protein
VCRLGGEEFLVINANSTLDQALLCAERLRSSVAAQVIRCEGFQGSVTVSLGCAEKSGGGEGHRRPAEGR